MLQDIKNRLNRITKSTWMINKNLSGSYDVAALSNSLDKEIVATFISQVYNETDADFVVHAPRDIEFLLNRVEKLESENKNLNNVLLERKGMVETKSPIMEFKTLSQAYECLKEWQERLFLTNWIIKLELLDTNDDEDFGEVKCNFETQKATIKLYQKSSNETEIKKCMEKTLIHELLHLSFYIYEYGDNASVEQCLFIMNEHRKVEQMAKSLLMSKYNLSFDWFKNFKEETEKSFDDYKEMKSRAELEKIIEGLNLDSVNIKWNNPNNLLPTKNDTCEKYHNCVIAIHKCSKRKLFHWETVKNNSFDFCSWTQITPSILNAFKEPVFDGLFDKGENYE